MGVTALALAVSLDVPAHAAASACTHHLSGPQICISTTGPSGSANPGRVHTAWTNPPRVVTDFFQMRLPLMAECGLLVCSREPHLGRARRSAVGETDHQNARLPERSFTGP
ncbi:hypothetical protein AMK10_30590 [Streptomyces sp. CB02058]|nr:hypothetical protein AMK10_30590 [Streptomyces sp. CB02058]